MNIEYWKDRVKECKGYSVNSTRGEKVSVFSESNTEYVIRLNKSCSQGHNHKEDLIINFYQKPKILTVFQVDMLKEICLKKRKPRDYANYHNCPAGKEFIEKIEQITIKKNI